MAGVLLLFFFISDKCFLEKYTFFLIRKTRLWLCLLVSQIMLRAGKKLMIQPLLLLRLLQDKWPIQQTKLHTDVALLLASPMAYLLKVGKRWVFFYISSYISSYSSWCRNLTTLTTLLPSMPS